MRVSLLYKSLILSVSSCACLTICINPTNLSFVYLQKEGTQDTINNRYVKRWCIINLVTNRTYAAILAKRLVFLLYELNKENQSTDLWKSRSLEPNADQKTYKNTKWKYNEG